MSTANRVIKNTGFLYAKMGITMFISLYTTRLILNSLGASDFGIFSLIGGVIAMLGFFNGALAGATQRFMSFYEGKGDKEKQKQIFNISLVLHFFIALFLGVVLLVIGYFFLDGILNIPTDRVYAAKVVFGSLIISTMFSVMSVPYEAVLNAHENMFYYSIVGVLESLLKLGVAYAVVFYWGDKLELYGILMACIPILILSIMRVYCHKHYEECKISIKEYWDSSLLRKMTSFAGWNFMSIAVSMLTNYGQGIILNVFFGPIVNAAQGIASQVFGQLSAFSNNMLKAVNPIIVKSKGGEDDNLFKQATFIASKMGFFLMAIFAIPFIFEAHYIFKIWLGAVPKYTIIFTQLLLIRELLNQLFIPLNTSIASTGKIKEYKILVSILYSSILILAYISFQQGGSPISIYIIFIAIEFIKNFGVILYFAKVKARLNPISFLKEVCLRSILSALIAVLVTISISYYMDEGLQRLILTSMFFAICYIFTTYLLCLNTIEKTQVITTKRAILEKIIQSNVVRKLFISNN